MLTFRSLIVQAVVAHFFLQENKKMYVNEIARRLNLNRGNLVRKLEELEREGILKSQWQGNQRHYFLNRDFPLLKEYKRIVQKTIGLEPLLKARLKDLSGVKQAMIFGSYAEDKMNLSSDIDILVIGRHNTLQLHRIIADIQKITDREINAVSLSTEEYNKKLGTDPLLKSIHRKKTVRIV